MGTYKKESKLPRGNGRKIGAILVVVHAIIFIVGMSDDTINYEKGFMTYSFGALAINLIGGLCIAYFGRTTKFADCTQKFIAEIKEKLD